MTVPYIPGGKVYRANSLRSVTKLGSSLRIPRADTPNRSRSVGIDRSTVLLLLGFCLVADGGALFVLGWLYGGH